jgi:hypothetical protein
MGISSEGTSSIGVASIRQGGLLAGSAAYPLNLQARRLLVNDTTCNLFGTPTVVANVEFVLIGLR